MELHRSKTRHMTQVLALEDTAATPEAARKLEAAPKSPGSCPGSAPIAPGTIRRAVQASPGATARALAATLRCEEAAVVPALMQAHSDYDVYSKGKGREAAWFPC